MSNLFKLQVRSLGRHLGGEVANVNLAEPLEKEVAALIKAALLKHLVLVFPNQRLTKTCLAAFARNFGEFQLHDYIRGAVESPSVIEIRKEAEHAQNFGGSWHSDNSYLRAPPLGSVLHAVEIPAQGGDTIWANQYAAYSQMPDKLKSLTRPLLGVHSVIPAFGDMIPLKGSSISLKERTVTHPLIRTHPETKQQCLFHSGSCTVGIQGWSYERSQPLLNRLLSYATEEEITYRHKWQRNDVVLWDNRCTMHVALNDYGGNRRVMHRASIRGEVPV